MANVAGENAEAAGVIGGCIVFPPHLEQYPGGVEVLAVLASEFVF
jgi:hypothetical protein